MDKEKERERTGLNNMKAICYEIIIKFYFLMKHLELI